MCSILLVAGLLIAALAVGVVWFARAGEEHGHRVDAGSYEEFVNAGASVPVLFLRDDFYLVQTEAGELKALYAYPPIAQARERADCPVTWQEMDRDAGPSGSDGGTGRFRDPCFGATFTRDGAWVSGPSSRGLDQFPVDVKGGRILVDTGRLVCNGPGPCRRL